MKRRCPDLSDCKLFSGDIKIPEELVLRYKCHFCLGNENDDSWLSCKRYQFKSKNDFCPDFIMPNSLLSEKQINEKLLGLSIKNQS